MALIQYNGNIKPSILDTDAQQAALKLAQQNMLAANPQLAQSGGAVNPGLVNPGLPTSTLPKLNVPSSLNLGSQTTGSVAPKLPSAPTTPTAPPPAPAPAVAPPGGLTKPPINVPPGLGLPPTTAAAPKVPSMPTTQVAPPPAPIVQNNPAPQHAFRPPNRGGNPPGLPDLPSLPQTQVAPTPAPKLTPAPGAGVGSATGTEKAPVSPGASSSANTIDYNGDGKVDQLDQEIADRIASARAQNQALLQQTQMENRAQAGRFGLSGSGALASTQGAAANIANRTEQQNENDIIQKGLSEAIAQEQAQRQQTAFKDAQYKSEIDQDADLNGDGFIGDPALGHKTQKAGGMGNYGDGDPNNNFDPNNPNDPNNPLKKKPKSGPSYIDSKTGKSAVWDPNVGAPEDSVPTGTGQNLPPSEATVKNAAVDTNPFDVVGSDWTFMGEDASWTYYKKPDGTLVKMRS